MKKLLIVTLPLLASLTTATAYAEEECIVEKIFAGAYVSTSHHLELFCSKIPMIIGNQIFDGSFRKYNLPNIENINGQLKLIQGNAKNSYPRSCTDIEARILNNEIHIDAKCKNIQGAVVPATINLGQFDVKKSQYMPPPSRY